MEISIEQPNVEYPVTVRKQEIIQRMLTNNRRIFGVMGAHLTHLDDPSMKSKLPEGWVCKNLQVEKSKRTDVSNSIASWLQDKPNAVMIMSLKTPNIEPDFDKTGLYIGFSDAIIVVGSHIMVITMHSYRGGKDDGEHVVKYSADSNGFVTTASGRSVDGGDNVTTPIIKAWADLLQAPIDNDEELTFIGAHVMLADHISMVRLTGWWQTVKEQYCYILEQSRLLEQLSQWYAKIDDSEKSYISTGLVAQLAQYMVRPYSRIQEMLQKSHVNISNLV